MVDPTGGGGIQVDYTINIWNLIGVGAAAALVYARLVKVETQIAPIVEWWNQLTATAKSIGYPVGFLGGAQASIKEHQKRNGHT